MNFNWSFRGQRPVQKVIIKLEVEYYGKTSSKTSKTIILEANQENGTVAGIS